MSARRVIGVLLVIGAVMELAKSLLRLGSMPGDAVAGSEAMGWIGITVALLCLGLVLLLGGRQQQKPSEGEASSADAAPRERDPDK